MTTIKEVINASLKKANKNWIPVMIKFDNTNLYFEGFSDEVPERMLKNQVVSYTLTSTNSLTIMATK